MADYYKAVFLPIDERILDLYKGYVLHGQMLPDLKKEDVYKETTYFEIDKGESKIENVLKFVILILFLPLLILAAIIGAVFKKYEFLADKLSHATDSLVGFFFKKKVVKKTKSKRLRKYEDAVEEDVLEFLNHCHKNFTKVFIYSYTLLDEEGNKKIEHLLQQGLINSFVNISNLSGLQILFTSQSISLHNSFVVVKEFSEADEVKKLWGSANFKTEKNIKFWIKGKWKYDAGYSEFRWSCEEAIISMKKNVTHYLEAKDKPHFTNETVLFIEGAEDKFLNNYISSNLTSINKRLKKKNIQLFYLPFIKRNGDFFHEGVYDILRYQIPFLYSLSEPEIQSCLNALIQKLSSSEFYRLVLDRLELPYFKKPALLRSVAGGHPDTEKKFTYSTIEYKSKMDLDSFFDWYIKQVKIPNDGDGIFFSAKAITPEEYDADNYFVTESLTETNELKSKIDSIKAEGKYGVIAEALMYMLETLKEENPELLLKVKPLIEKRKLLESKLVLSSIYIDKQKRIFLPDFGNIEVKMHALPKTVYLFFLQHSGGIRFKELYQHKKELLEIYNTVTNKFENEEIKRAIDDLVDMKKPNINQQCSRIRASFRSIMDEHIAKYYYIDGLNGEPKKISLPQNLLDIRYI